MERSSAKSEPVTVLDIIATYAFRQGNEEQPPRSAVAGYFSELAATASERWSWSWRAREQSQRDVAVEDAKVCPVSVQIGRIFFEKFRKLRIDTERDTSLLPCIMHLTKRV